MTHSGAKLAATVACSVGSACRVTLTLTVRRGAKTVVLARRTVTVGAGSTRIVRVSLDRAGRKRSAPGTS